jgi:erythromycin esterase-like protein
MPTSFVDDLVGELVEMQRRRAARSGRAPSGESWFRAIQGTLVAQRAEAYYRALVAGAPSGWSLREIALADTVDLLSAQQGAAGAAPKLVVWAHNARVGDSREAGRRHTLGGVLRQRHGREVGIVGFTTYGGTVACAHEWDGPPAVEDLPPGNDGSWEHVFHDAGVPRFMVTSSALRRAAGENAERPHRAVGAVYRSDAPRWSSDAPARLADRYDVIVHVDRTSALEPLPRSVPDPYDAWAEGFTELYPTAP